jgi:hypothetical protein
LLVGRQLSFVGCQLLIVLGELGDLLFEVADLIIQFLDQVFGLLLFFGRQVLLVQQAADVGFQFGDRAIIFVTWLVSLLLVPVSESSLTRASSKFFCNWPFSSVTLEI